MIQELVEAGSGRVFRRTGGGPWQKSLQGETDAAMLSELGVGELLWSGSFKGGTITVPGISDYMAVVIITDGEMYRGEAVIMVRSKDKFAVVDGEHKYKFSGGFNTTAAATTQGNGTVAYAFYADGDVISTIDGSRPGTVEFTKDNATRWQQDFKEIYGLFKAAGDYQ